MLNATDRVLITGASGFVGQALCKALHKKGIEYIAAVRQQSDQCSLSGCVATLETGDLISFNGWKAALESVDVIVHLAGRAHIMDETEDDPWAVYRAVNYECTKALVMAAQSANVRRFIFISTVKVHGESSKRPFVESDTPEPADHYAKSKYLAEQCLIQLIDPAKMEMVILRPPLVYGPGVKANFKFLVEAVKKRIPLPLSGIQNTRSLIYVENLVDIIITCMHHPSAGGEVYLVSDDEDVSTPELVKRIARAIGRPCIIFPIWKPLLNAAAIITGKRSALERLMDCLAVDITKVKNQLGWKPPISMAEGLERTVEGLGRRCG